MVHAAWMDVYSYFAILEMTDSKAPTRALTLLLLALPSLVAVSWMTLLYSLRLLFRSSVFWCRSARAGTTNPARPSPAKAPDPELDADPRSFE
jgi:hypothetical protein